MARQQQAAEEMEPQNAAVGGRRIRTANTHISKYFWKSSALSNAAYVPSSCNRIKSGYS